MLLIYTSPHLDTEASSFKSYLSPQDTTVLILLQLYTWQITCACFRKCSDTSPDDMVSTRTAETVI